MRKILKRLFCKHKHKEPYNKYVYTGEQAVFYRTKCKKCGKVWEL